MFVFRSFSRLSPVGSGGTNISFHNSANDLFLRHRPDFYTVLFFDCPGEGPKSWEEAYEPEYEKTPERKRNGFPHSYVHPFLTQVVDGEVSVPAYELVLQYWFYYRTNDGGNNHEGDWEHLNVVVSPRSMVERPLTAEVVGRILTGALPATDDAPDPLVIRRVEYYFHHFVMTLDYADPNVYVPRNEWEADIKSRSKTHVKIQEIWKDTRYMAYVDDKETKVNTHPIGYIGADNFSTRFATYPFKLAFGKRDPVYYPKEGVPFRFFGLSSGVTTQIFDDDYYALAFNPIQYHEFILQLLFHLLENGADSTTVAVSGSDFKSNSVAPFFQVSFYIGGRFTSENTIRNMRPSFGATVDFNNIPSYTYRAEINFWEYAGSVRYSFSPCQTGISKYILPATGRFWPVYFEGTQLTFL